MTPHPYTVADVMTKKVVAVAPKASFKDIVTAMSRWSVSALPVIEGEGHVVGVVSEADLLPKEEFHERRPGLVEQMRRLDATAKAASLSAEDLITRPALTIGPDAPLPQAARLMATRGVKRLPVVEAGVLKGIVSRSDLLKVFLRPDDELAEEVREQVVARLFPVSREKVTVQVDAGVVTMSGVVREAGLLPVATRLARAVEGVVPLPSVGGSSVIAGPVAQSHRTHCGVRGVAGHGAALVNRPLMVVAIHHPVLLASNSPEPFDRSGGRGELGCAVVGPPADAFRVPEVTALPVPDQAVGDPARSLLRESAAERDVLPCAETLHPAGNPTYRRDIPLFGRIVDRTAAEEPDGQLPQLPRMTSGAPAGLDVPASCVDSATENHGVIAAHVVDTVGGHHHRVESVGAKRRSQLLSDSLCRSVLASVGDQHTCVVHVTHLAPGWTSPSLRRPSARATCSFTAAKLSGATEIESMPDLTRNSVKAGSSLGR